MKNQWLRYFSGVVSMIVSGKDTVLFMNACVQADIHLWNVRALEDEEIIMFVSLKHISKIRKIRRKFDVDIRFHHRQGMPFVKKRIIKNLSFVIGTFLFLFLTLLLSNMVWDIKITGASPAVEYRMYKQLNQMGVKKGSIQFLLNTPQEIQKKLTDANGDITWVGVNLHGTVYHLRVVEKTIPKPPVVPKPRNLVASKSAVITYILAEKGQSLVSVHEYVRKGQVLVSGYIGNEDKALAVAATGTVLGETWYRTAVTVPVEENISSLTGLNKTQYGLSFGEHQVLIPFLKKPKYEDKEVMSTEAPIYFYKWKLPFRVVRKTFYEKQTFNQRLTEIEAKEKALEVARSEVARKIPADASIKGIKVLHEATTNGKVVMVYHFQIIENVGTYINLP